MNRVWYDCGLLVGFTNNSPKGGIVPVLAVRTAATRMVIVWNISDY
ncbi:hypothetical protein [Pediococcus ethanolidurans]|nr:hypothetical protein [Pediococcus ethanolidurans]